MKHLPTLLVCALLACNGEDPQQIIDRSISVHGGEAMMNKTISFVFRDRNYSVTRSPERYVYTRNFQDSLGEITDILVNSSEFYRTLDQDTIEVDSIWQRKYARSVNGVLYFFQLPFLLNDPAVNKKYLGNATIKGEPYHAVRVTFEQTGGGEDYEDVFVYWFHAQNHTMDYLAYSYETDGGGVRFREAINRLDMDGILFQDYINYEVDPGISLEEIPRLYENGLLKELSRIQNHDIRVRPLP